MGSTGVVYTADMGDSVIEEDQRRLGRLVCDMREVNKWVRPVSSILPTWATQFM
eukprot:COSAG02_NODE_1436_length_12609_cov_1282.385292_5_plen_54_part_00